MDYVVAVLVSVPHVKSLCRVYDFVRITEEPSQVVSNDVEDALYFLVGMFVCQVDGCGASAGLRYHILMRRQ